MLRIIRNKSISEKYLTEMAIGRSKAIEKIQNQMPYINEHIVKCVMYSDMRDTVEHWINVELTPAFNLINSINVKTKSSKLDKSTYKAIMRDEFGEDVNDAYVNLLEVQVNNIKDKKYPIIEPTEEMSQRLFEAYQKIVGEFSEKFAKISGIQKYEINQFLHLVLKVS